MPKEDLSELAHPQYWDERYKKPEEQDRYDWLRDFKAVKSFLLKHLPSENKASAKILHVGCGNSNWERLWVEAVVIRIGCYTRKSQHGERSDVKAKGLDLYVDKQTLPIDLHNLGYTNQISIDFSQTCIDLMSQKHPELNFQLMDCRSMTFDPNTFDVVLDKATLDAMLYGSLWDPEPEVRDNVKRYVDEVARVLKGQKDGGHGKFLYITWRQPHFIRPLIQREGIWNVEVETIGGEDGAFEYFGFIMTKS